MKWFIGAGPPPVLSARIRPIFRPPSMWFAIHPSQTLTDLPDKLYSAFPRAPPSPPFLTLYLHLAYLSSMLLCLFFERECPSKNKHLSLQSREGAETHFRQQVSKMRFEVQKAFEHILPDPRIIEDITGEG